MQTPIISERNCRACVWDRSQHSNIHCTGDEGDQCALKSLIHLSELRDEGLTTARVGDLTLFSAFQPIYSLSHERVVGYEALIRGVRDGEPVPPWEIITANDDFAQLVYLDRLCRAIHIRNFQRHLRHNAWLFLNINPRVAVDGKQFGSFFGKLLDSTGIAPQRVVVEILEHAIIDEAQLARTVAYYRSMGCLIALDDFGSGHSNFDRIMRIQPDIVKMDTAMIRQAGSNVVARRIMPNLVAMLHEAGCLVLVEGVETEDEALITLDANVDFVQGFYFARPSAPMSLPSHKETFQQLDQSYKRQYEVVRYQRRQEMRQYKQRFAEAAAAYNHGVPLDTACKQLLEMESVQRCYLLDSDGKQLGDNLYPITRQVPINTQFLPLADTRGANWNRKPYFRDAIGHPGKVRISRPYLSTASVELSATLSICIDNKDELQVLCCDLSYHDEGVVKVESEIIPSLHP